MRSPAGGGRSREQDPLRRAPCAVFSRAAGCRRRRRRAERRRGRRDERVRVVRRARRHGAEFPEFGVRLARAARRQLGRRRRGERRERFRRQRLVRRERRKPLRETRARTLAHAPDVGRPPPATESGAARARGARPRSAAIIARSTRRAPRRRGSAAAPAATVSTSACASLSSHARASRGGIAAACRINAAHATGPQDDAPRPRRARRVEPSPARLNLFRRSRRRRQRLRPRVFFVARARGSRHRRRPDDHRARPPCRASPRHA